MTSIVARRPLIHPLLQACADSLAVHAIGATTRVGVGLSGGCDSVALLGLLYALPPERRPHLILLHIDHGIRSPQESDADVALVRQYGTTMALECVVHRIPYGELPQRAGRAGLEAAARAARYAFYSDMSRRHRLDCVLLAHHQDDQCETVIMRLLQGCGLAGLGGIPEVRLIKTMDYTYRIVRPLLHIAGARLREYVAMEGLVYREDATNRLTNHLRNRIRADLMPAIERCFGGYRTAVGRVAQLARSNDDFISQESTRRLQWRRVAGGFEMERHRFFAAPEALRLRSLYSLAEQSRPPIPRLAYRFLYPATLQDRPLGQYTIVRGHGIELVVKNERIIWQYLLAFSPNNSYYCIIVKNEMSKQPFISTADAPTRTMRVGLDAGGEMIVRYQDRQSPVVFRNAQIDDTIDSIYGHTMLRYCVDIAAAAVVEDRYGIICAFDGETHVGRAIGCQIGPLGSDEIVDINIELDKVR